MRKNRHHILLLVFTLFALPGYKQTDNGHIENKKAAVAHRMKMITAQPREQSDTIRDIRQLPLAPQDTIVFI